MGLLSFVREAGEKLFGRKDVEAAAAEPSAADRSVTARIKQALGLVEIRLLDHFVIGDGAPTSMARLGMV